PSPPPFRSSDGLAPKRRATPPAARQRPWPDAEIVGGEVSFEPPSTSFDHLVGAGEQGRRNFYAERPRGLEIDHQIVLCWRLHRQIGGLLAPEDAINVAGRAPVLVDQIRPIGD